MLLPGASCSYGIMERWASPPGKPQSWTLRLRSGQAREAPVAPPNDSSGGNGNRSNLDQRRRVDCHGAWLREPLPKHVRRRYARPVERLLAIRGGRTPHASFHIGQSRTPRAAADVRAGRADGQVFGFDRADLVHLWRKIPDIQKPL